MSVPSYKRKQSSSQYIQTAQNLMKFTLQKSLKLPKRYTFFISTDLVKTAQDVYKKVMIIQTLYSQTSEHDLKKVELCEESIGLLNYLTSQLDIVKVYCPNLQENTFIKWLELIEEEKRLLKGLIKKLEK